MSLPRQVWALTLWPLLEQWLNFLVGFVDVTLAARLEPEAVGVAATDALAIATFVAWLINVLQSAVALGTSVMVARAVGGGRRAVANAALGQGVVMIGGMGVLAGLLIYLVAPLIGALAGAKGDALAFCVLYLRVVAVAVPFSTILFIGNAALRAAGDARTPFTIMIAVNLVNTAASITLVRAGFGVAGIAAGTSLAWVVGTVLVVGVLVRGKRGVRLRLLRMRPHWHTARRILGVGLPNLLENVGHWGGSFAMLAIIGRMAPPEAGYLGIFTIAVRIESMSFMGGFAVGMAAATLVGQYLGAGLPEMAQRAVRLCWLSAVGLMSGFGLLFLLFPQQITRLVTEQSVHLAVVPAMVWWTCFAQPFFATTIVLSQTMRGAGDTRTPLMLTYASTLLYRLTWACLAAFVLDLGMVGLWIGLVCEWPVRALLFTVFYFRGRWLRVAV